MAYFSNGSEGEYLDTMCSHCIHYDDPDKAWDKKREYKPCPVYNLQALWNYDQDTNNMPKSEEDAVTTGQVKFFVLNLLVPNEKEYYQSKGVKGVLCSMFVMADELKEKLLAEIRAGNHDLFPEDNKQ